VTTAFTRKYKMMTDRRTDGRTKKVCFFFII
jgi:hypothetical protein